MSYSRIFIDGEWKIIGEDTGEIAGLAWNAERVASEAIAPLPADIIALLAGQGYIEPIPFYEPGQPVPTMADNWQLPASAALGPGQTLADVRAAAAPVVSGVTPIGKPTPTGQPVPTKMNTGLIVIAGVILVFLAMGKKGR